MKKLLPQPLRRMKAILIMAGLATALVSETFAQSSPTPTPTPQQRGKKLLPAPPSRTPYSG